MNSKAGWTLVLAGILLLAALGKLDMLLVSLPLAAVVACTVSWIDRGHTGVTTGLKWK